MAWWLNHVSSHHKTLQPNLQSQANRGKKEGIKLVVIAGLGAATAGLFLLGTVGRFCQKRSVWEMIASTSTKCLQDLMFILQELRENSVVLLSVSAS